MVASQSGVILLVGPSCAGKSTLARAIQDESAEPYLVQALDGLFAAVPEAWGGSGRRTGEGFRYDWTRPPSEGDRGVRRIAHGPVGWRMLMGFHRAVAAFAAAGVNVVVDDMLLDEAVLEDWAAALEAVPTLLVSVTAPRETLLQREAERTLHPTPGLVAGHFDLHAAIPSDLRIDTSTMTPPQAAREVLQRAASLSGAAALKGYRRGSGSDSRARTRE